MLFLPCNSAWGDQLTAYNGQAITYDANGNPISYYNGSTFEWSGRRLTKATKNNVIYTFTYDDEGRRTSKSNGSVTTYYYYNGNSLIAEVSTNGEIVVYAYDSFGSPVSFGYFSGSGTWEEYFYEKNVQGDIIGIYNTSGVALVKYAYDACGNIASTTYQNGGSSTNANKNSLFYRGYVYDRDLELYCLKTRYYDSKTGRFISPDNLNVTTVTPLGLTDKNLYAYCDNNPVMRVDHGGEFWIFAVVATVIVSSVVNFVLAHIEESTEDNYNKESVIASTAINTIADVATVMFPAAAPCISSVTNATGVLVENLIDEDITHKSTGEIVSETISAAVIGFFDGLSVRPLGITYEMGAGKAIKEAVKDYLSGVVPDLFKQGFQDFWLDRCV